MPTDNSAPRDEVAAMQPLVGEWTEEVLLDEPVPAGRMTIEWDLDGRYLVQRCEIPEPAFPDSLAILAPDPASGAFRQHYFDSCGVVRLYKMDLRDGVWTLVRDEPDFSPLDFAQRFTGTFSPDGKVIDARWETSRDGGPWELDFELRYTKVG